MIWHRPFHTVNAGCVFDESVKRCQVFETSVQFLLIHIVLPLALYPSSTESRWIASMRRISCMNSPFLMQYRIHDDRELGMPSSKSKWYNTSEDSSMAWLPYRQMRGNTECSKLERATWMVESGDDVLGDSRS